MKRQTAFRLSRCGLSRVNGGCPIPVMERNLMRLGVCGSIAGSRPGWTSTTWPAKQGQQQQPNRQTLGSAEPTYQNHPRPRFFDKEVATRIPDTFSSNQRLGDSTLVEGHVDSSTPGVCCQLCQRPHRGPVFWVKEWVKKKWSRKIGREKKRRA